MLQLTLTLLPWLVRPHPLQPFHPEYKDVRGPLSPSYPPVEESREYWHNSMQEQLRHQLDYTARRGRATNVIFFLGDGMGVSTLTAARILKGQQQGLQGGERASLAFETFPEAALCRTYCVDSTVADSACSATAYLGGVKANIGTLGVTAAVKYKQCSGQNDPESSVSSLLSWAQSAGLATGLVTTTKVTHASPAAAYAHVANREWYTDREVAADLHDPAVCHDIAKQLVRGRTGRGLDVVLGGGRADFLPAGQGQQGGRAGRRGDGVDLLAEWAEDKAARNLSHAVITSKEELRRVVEGPGRDRVLGLFAPSHMAYSEEQEEPAEPSLEEMTRAAVSLLAGKERGYVLFIEEGMIDLAHHLNQARRALQHTLELDKAVTAALELVDLEDTLIIVTADHSHGLTLNGYPDRGADILGLGGESEVSGHKFPTLLYSTGPGHREQADITAEDLAEPDSQYPAMVPQEVGHHSGEEVVLYAAGPQAHLFRGLLQQSYIPHALAYAACIGRGATVCD